MMNKCKCPEELIEMYASHYEGEEFIKVRESGYIKSMIGSNNFANRDDMEILVNGNDERIIISSRFDNLGKGASGAAIQCMNIALGLDEKTGLNLKE